VVYCAGQTDVCQLQFVRGSAAPSPDPYFPSPWVCGHLGDTPTGRQKTGRQNFGSESVLGLEIVILVVGLPVGVSPTWQATDRRQRKLTGTIMCATALHFYDKSGLHLQRVWKKHNRNFFIIGISEWLGLSSHSTHNTSSASLNSFVSHYICNRNWTHVLHNV